MHTLTMQNPVVFSSQNLNNISHQFTCIYSNLDTKRIWIGKQTMGFCAGRQKLLIATYNCFTKVISKILVSHSPTFKAFLVFSQNPQWVYCTSKPIEHAIYCLSLLISEGVYHVKQSTWRKQGEGFAFANVFAIPTKIKQRCFQTTLLATLQCEAFSYTKKILLTLLGSMNASTSST